MRTLALPAALAAAVLALIAVAVVLSGSPPAAVDVEMPAPRLAELRDRCAAAVGEAFDKTAKMLGLGYPGGAMVESAAVEGDA